MVSRHCLPGEWVAILLLVPVSWGNRVAQHPVPVVSGYQQAIWQLSGVQLQVWCVCVLGNVRLFFLESGS